MARRAARSVRAAAAVRAGRGDEAPGETDAAAACGARAAATATRRRLSAEQVAAYHRDGFVIVPLFTAEEASALLSLAESDAVVNERAHGRTAAPGGITLSCTLGVLHAPPRIRG